jgi:hypothetical protein
MKKLIIPLAAAAATLAIVPSSALAVSDWGGWQTQHSDNLGSPGYLSTLGNNGIGNNQYCVDLTTTSTQCGTSIQNGGTAIYSPLVFAAVLMPPACQPTGCLGCSNQDSGRSDNNNVVQSPTGDGNSDPCLRGSPPPPPPPFPPTDENIAAVYIGFSGSPDEPSPVDPGQGIVGVQG